MTRPVALIAFAVVSLQSCAPAKISGDEASLRALDAAYVEAWLNEDAGEQEKAVLALFDRDAAIMPGGGAPAAEGVNELREFWFPEGASPTIVTHFSHEIESVDVAPPLGVVAGRYTLSFTYENQSATQAGNYLIVAKSGPRGWMIERMIWNDQPLTEV